MGFVQNVNAIGSMESAKAGKRNNAVLVELLDAQRYANYLAEQANAHAIRLVNEQMVTNHLLSELVRQNGATK